MFSLEEILEELSSKTGVSKDDLLKKIEKKQEELSGLVSMEGAAHLVARDLGIDLLKKTERFLQLKDVKPDMKRVNLKAKVVSVTPIREFSKKDGTVGKVKNLLISDGTGQARIPLWDKQIEILNEINIGDVLELKNVSTKQSVFGSIDLVLNKWSVLRRVEEDIPVEPMAPKRISIRDATEGYFEIKAMIVDIFNVNPIFYVCPSCKGKVEKDVCMIHGKIEPEKNIVISGVIDDGTGVLRSVFFREAAKGISGLDEETLEKLELEEAINLIKENTIGKEFLLKGRIQKNKIFENLELVVEKVDEVNVMEEIENLIEELDNA
ncbi:MAG: DUF2240 family protein [Candidatus Aenigmarchaeota archaeon]|nr:DUF2240 family protein [Candidatus Aenigmarchaeota archaeon]